MPTAIRRDPRQGEGVSVTLCGTAATAGYRDGGKDGPVLVVAPHPDDESIGCGGAICLHRQRMERVDAVFLTSGERGMQAGSDGEARAIRESEARAACEVLGVHQVDFLRHPDLGLGEDIDGCARELARVIEARTPRIIYLPHPGESHPDHAAVLPIIREALARLPATARALELWAYEVWSPMTRHGWVEDITAVMSSKLRAIRCYRSQLAALRYDRAARALNHYRGLMLAGSSYAEAFTYLPSRDRRRRAVAAGRRATPV